MLVKEAPDDTNHLSESVFTYDKFDDTHEYIVIKLVRDSKYFIKGKAYGNRIFEPL